LEKLRRYAKKGLKFFGVSLDLSSKEIFLNWPNDHNELWREQNTGVVLLVIFNQAPDSLLVVVHKKALFPCRSLHKRAFFLLFDTEMRHARG